MSDLQILNIDLSVRQQFEVATKLVDIESEKQIVIPYLKRLETIDLDDYRSYLQENGYPMHSDSINVRCGDRWLTYKDETPFFDYCLMNHYDYRGLIDKGLAIEVTKENNPYI